MGHSSAVRVIVQSWKEAPISCLSALESLYESAFQWAPTREPLPGDWGMLQNSNSDKSKRQWETVRLPSVSAGREWDTRPIYYLSKEVLGTAFESKLSLHSPLAMSLCTDGRISWKLDLEIPGSISSLEDYLFPLSLLCIHLNGCKACIVFSVSSSLLISLFLMSIKAFVFFVSLSSSTYLNYNFIYFWM